MKSEFSIFAYIGRSEENVLDNMSHGEAEDIADLESISLDLESMAREQLGLGCPDVSDTGSEAIDPELRYYVTNHPPGALTSCGQ